jgi:putative N6-adenine-specific DNA methylase
LARNSSSRGSVPLVDPLAGSGTIAIEGALIARRMAPGLGRAFAFEEWPSFEPAAWREVREAAEAQRLAHAPVPIMASDRDAGAVAAAGANAARAGVSADIEIRRAALSSIAPGAVRGLVATNPPYGARVGERKRLRDLYAQLGHVLRRACAGWDLVMLSPHAELERQVGLGFRTLAETSNGGLRVRLVSAPVPEAAAVPR